MNSIKPLAFVKRGQHIDIKTIIDNGYAPILVMAQDDVRIQSTLSNTSLADLATYLSAHETDIALGVNDFEKLACVFTDVFGKDAQK